MVIVLMTNSVLYETFDDTWSYYMKMYNLDFFYIKGR